ncbi:hypothetical protein FHX37_0899 [Haloactinospora alba]|uniref:Secreted protein n=1 Tax=Haloactinospora alba TaxID=405555 RepID=A0A543NGY4_9ACTN|nr:hypothetical protein [Haloactinospora alba]TQN31010.1 hypothetical protein FHX37_0899 [Haloactinospora alba]
MVTPQQRVTYPLALAACSLLLAGCGMFGGEDGDSRDGDSADPANAGKVEPGEEDARDTLASQDVQTLGTDLHIAVHDLVRGAETVELTFSITNTGDDASDLFHTWLGNGPDGGGEVSDVTLVDSANGKVHLVAEDDDGKCVCSTYNTSEKFAPGDSVLYSATFGTPPDGVETMDVRIPNAGTFNNVELS